MTNPTVFPEYIINNGIDVNKSGVAILNNTTLGIHRTQEIQKKITGKHCDIQMDPFTVQPPEPRLH